MTVYVKMKRKPDGGFTWTATQEIFDKAGINADVQRFALAIRDGDKVEAKRVRELIDKAMRERRIRFI